MLHDLHPEHVIGKHWRITTPGGYVFFKYRKAQKGYAMAVTEANLAKLRSVGVPRESSRVVSHATTVKEREAQFTKSELRRAQKALERQRVLCFPGVGTLARTLNKSGWANMSMTAADVRLSTDIYGPETRTMQGKARQPKNAKAQFTDVPVPLHMRGQQKMYADVFFWREKAYLACIVKPLYLVITRDVPAKALNTDGYRAALLWTVDHVQKRGFTVSDILVDADKLLAPLIDEIPNLIAAEAGAKVGDIEVEIRVLEEMLRSTEASLPVPVLLRHTDHEVARVTLMRNRVVRQGMSICPNEAFTGRRTEDKDLEGGFYDYCQAYRKPKSKNGPEIRTVAALKLYPMFNGRGGYYYYDLSSESYFTGSRTPTLPMPELVVQKIIAIWKREMPERKKAMRAAWKLGRLGKDYMCPVEGNELEEYRLLLEQAHPIQPRRDGEQAPELPALLAGQGPMPGMEMPGEPADRDQLQMPAAEEIDDRDDGDDDWTGEPDPIANEGEVAQGLEDQAPADVDAAAEENGAFGDPRARAREGAAYAASRKSARLASRRVDTSQLRLYRLTLKKALKLNKRSTRDAVMKELRQMLDLSVWTYIERADLSKSQMRKVIRSLMFLKEK